MDELIWKKDLSQKFSSAIFSEIIQKLLNSRTQQNEFDFRLVSLESNERKENYFGLTRYGWNNCQNDILVDFASYFKKNVVELYLRNY